MGGIIEGEVFTNVDGRTSGGWGKNDSDLAESLGRSRGSHLSKSL